MADVTHRAISIEELTTEQPDSTDPAYLAWKKQKIEATLRNDERHPERRREAEDVFRGVSRRLEP